MTLEDFADLLEAGGAQLYPDQIPFTRSAAITEPVTVQPATPGAVVKKVAPANFAIGPGGNLIATQGNVADVSLQFAVDCGIVDATGVWQGSLTWFRGKGGQAQAPNIDITVLNGTGPPPATGANNQPNWVQANSAGGSFKVTAGAQAILANPGVPGGLPDVLVMGGGPGFEIDVDCPEGFVEFDQQACPGISGSIVARKLLLGNLSPADFTDPATKQASVLKVTLLNPPAYPAFVYNVPYTGLSLRGTIQGAVNGPG